MIKKMFASALFAGFAAGLVVSALQFQFVQPVLLEAELYESGQRTHFSAPSVHEHSSEEAESAVPEKPAEEENHDHSTHSHDDAAANGEGIDFRRDGLTVIFNVFTYVGYGLLLVSAFAIAQNQGAIINARSGLIWGLAGFIAVQFAPAFGLAPELPGNAAADVQLRQVWWLATVVATGGGLALISFGKSWSSWAAAIVLIGVPHVIGAPLPAELAGPTPPELAGEFAARALGIGMVTWVVMGLCAGYLWQQE